LTTTILVTMAKLDITGHRYLSLAGKGKARRRVISGSGEDGGTPALRGCSAFLHISRTPPFCSCITTALHLRPPAGSTNPTDTVSPSALLR